MEDNNIEDEIVKPAECPKPQAEPLPKLSAADFRVYNRMAEHMDYYVRLCLESPVFRL